MVGRYSSTHVSIAAQLVPSLSEAGAQFDSLKSSATDYKHAAYSIRKVRHQSFLIDLQPTKDKQHSLHTQEQAKRRAELFFCVCEKATMTRAQAREAKTTSACKKTPQRTTPVHPNIAVVRYKACRKKLQHNAEQECHLNVTVDLPPHHFSLSAFLVAND